MARASVVLYSVNLAAVVSIPPRSFEAADEAR
jgi:hypothetical protein